MTGFYIYLNLFLITQFNHFLTIKSNKMNTTEFRSRITIFCKDNTTRIVNVIGRWTSDSAKELAKDLEGQNYFAHNVVIE